MYLVNEYISNEFLLTDFTVFSSPARWTLANVTTLWKNITSGSMLTRFAYTRI